MLSPMLVVRSYYLPETVIAICHAFKSVTGNVSQIWEQLFKMYDLSKPLADVMAENRIVTSPLPRAAADRRRNQRHCWKKFQSIKLVQGKIQEQC